MLTYEIRTFDCKWRSSLILLAQCPSDLAAIMVARDAVRKGQAVEVWRGDRLVYRVGLKSDRIEESQNPKAKPNRGWTIRFPRFRSEF